MFSGYTIFSLSLFLLDLSGSEIMEKKDPSPGGHTRSGEAMDEVQRYLNKKKTGHMNEHLYTYTEIFDCCI